MSKIGSKTVTKADIVNRVSNATGLTKVETEIVINGIMNTITSALENNRRVELRGFGTFGSKRGSPEKHAIREREKRFISPSDMSRHLNRPVCFGKM